MPKKASSSCGSSMKKGGSKEGKMPFVPFKKGEKKDKKGGK